MFPSSTDTDSVPKDSTERHDELQTPAPSDILTPPSQFQPNYGLRPPMHSEALSTGSTFNDREPPMPSSGDIHPLDPQGSPRYTGGFFAVLGTPGSPPIPRLRPASWGSPSQVDEAFESHRPARSRSSVDFRGSSSDEEEDPPFGGGPLPPLPVLNNPRRLGIRKTSNISSTSSRDHSLDSGDLSATNSLPSTSFLTNDPDGEYESASDQPEASTSAHRLPTTSPPAPRPESLLTDTKARPLRGRPSKPRPTPTPRASRRATSRGLGQHRDHLPEPGEVDVIECGWPGCKTPIQYDIRSVKDHIRFYHGGLFRAKEPLTCRWIRKDTEEECGSRLLPESLCRHTLDVHTNLVMKDCVCGKRFRRDTLGRHKCKAREDL